jgi:hypothetical protein
MRCQHCCLALALHLCACMRAAEGLWCARHRSHATRVSICSRSLVGRTRYMHWPFVKLIVSLVVLGMQNYTLCAERSVFSHLQIDAFQIAIQQFITAECIVLALVSLCAIPFYSEENLFAPVNKTIKCLAASKNARI